MKTKRFIISAFVIITFVVVVVLRLAANKRSFGEQLKMISEFNTTIPVITDTVKYEKMATKFSANGSFQAMREISVSSETQGRIVSIMAETGANVAAGQVLASIGNELLKSQLELAKFNLGKAEKDMQRFEQLSKGDAVTLQQYESAKQAFLNAQSAYLASKVQFENSFIKAPFDGIITKRSIEKGTWVQPGAPVFDMVEIKKVKFITNLTSNEIEKVQKGQIVNISVDAFPGTSYEGKVIAVVVKADASKRYCAEIEVINRPNKLIKPGMFGTGLFEGQFSNQVLTISRRALTGSIKNPEVFIVKGDSVTLQSISAVPLNDKYVAVTQGLKGGEVIVISGQINLVNGSKIKLTK
jgi:RND family efflux transporter MFP subunit